MKNCHGEQRSVLCQCAWRNCRFENRICWKHESDKNQDNNIFLKRQDYIDSQAVSLSYFDSLCSGYNGTFLFLLHYRPNYIQSVLEVEIEEYFKPHPNFNLSNWSSTLFQRPFSKPCLLEPEDQVLHFYCTKQKFCLNNEIFNRFTVLQKQIN